MITLTTPPAIKVVLGGNTTAAYDKMVLTNIAYDVANMAIRCTITLTSTAEPEQTPIKGNLEINTATSRLALEIEQLGFNRRIALSSGQNSSAQTIIRNAQNAIEAGIITIGVVAGVQSTGS